MPALNSTEDQITYAELLSRDPAGPDATFSMRIIRATLTTEVLAF